jgi:hypothetical protein
MATKLVKTKKKSHVYVVLGGDDVFGFKIISAHKTRQGAEIKLSELCLFTTDQFHIKKLLLAK